MPAALLGPDPALGGEAVQYALRCRGTPYVQWRTMRFEYSSSDSERLLELVVRLSGKLDKPMLWEDIVCSATSLLRSERGALLVADEESSPRLVAGVGLTEADRGLLNHLSDQGLQWVTRNGGLPIVVGENSYPLSRLASTELVTGDCSSAIYLPLQTAEGALCGVLVAFFADTYQYSEREARLLSQLALILGPLISNAQAHNTARRFAAAAGRRARKLHYLAEACAALSLAGGGSAALKRAASLATSWMADRCVIEIVDEESDLAATYTVCRMTGQWCDGGYGPIADGQRRSWLDKLLRTGEPVLLPGLSPDHPAVPGASCCGADWRPETGLSLLSVALRRQGRVIGAMTLLRQEQTHRPYENEDIAFAAEISRHTELALDYESPRTGRAASRIPLIKVQS